MRGASALDELLQEFRGRPIRAFVIWEPVLATDRAAPMPWTLSRARDPRVAQVWDRTRALSSEIVRSERERRGPATVGDEMDPSAIVWDAVLVFPPGVTWGERVPEPMLLEGPVASVIGRVREALSRSLGRRA